MNLTGVPAHCWLLWLVYLCALLNVTASPTLNGITPFEPLLDKFLTSVIFYIFIFWEPVYYKVNENEPDHEFPSQSKEQQGHWVGFGKNKDDQLTWKILTDETQQIITRYS